MRKALFSILTLLYLVMSCGVTLHYNYCKGRLTRVSLVADAGCPECAAKKSCCGECPCCKEVARLVRAEIDQDTAPSYAGIPEDFGVGVFSISGSITPSGFMPPAEIIFMRPHGPPDPHSRPGIYITACSLII